MIHNIFMTKTSNLKADKIYDTQYLHLAIQYHVFVGGLVIITLEVDSGWLPIFSPFWCASIYTVENLWTHWGFSCECRQISGKIPGVFSRADV